MGPETRKILEDAIADVGHWSWWDEDEATFQVEFGFTQLYNEPASPDVAPNGQVALRFPEATAIAVLHNADSHLPDGWFAALRRDELEPLSVGHASFTMTDSELARSLLEWATRVEFMRGTREDLDRALSGEGSFLCFLAGGAGLAVSAPEMVVVNHEGELDEEQICEKNRQWWEYWRRYWDVHDSPAALPKDFACDVTIPAG